MWKITINRPFWIFFVIIELVRELVTSKMQNNFEKDTWIFFKLSCPQRNVTANGDANEPKFQQPTFFNKK